MILTIAKIIVIWTLASIIAAECWALMRANQRERDRKADVLRRGGEVDFIQHREPSA
jgi:hypothetical protein